MSLAIFAEVRKSDGSDCKPDSLRVMLAAQTKWQQNIHSKGPRIHQVQTGPRGQSKSSLQKGRGNDQMQQKHFPFKMRSNYGKTMYLANKLQSHSFILCGICSPFILIFVVKKKCETVVHFISPLLKIQNPKCGTRNRGWVSIRSTPSWITWPWKWNWMYWEKLTGPFLILICGFASPLKWLQKQWFQNYFHWIILCYLPWMVWTGFTKKLPINFIFIYIKKLFWMPTPVFFQP